MDISRRCPEGSSESADAALYTTIRPLLYRIAFRVTRNHADAEDAVQETFLAVLQRSDQPTCTRAYLAIVVRNRAVSSFRDRRKDVRLDETLVVAAPVPTPPSHPTIRLSKYVKAAGGNRRLSTIWRAIAAGRTHREIARDLGTTVDAIRSLIYRSRKRLLRVAENGGASWS